ncbi:T9SS type A sorting domain-containing protein [bacterium]|nr:T9SS type A sorting domain-containing protein [bacterium]
MMGSLRVSLFVGLVFLLSSPSIVMARTVTEKFPTSRNLDDADPNAVHARIMHDVGNVRMTLFNRGEFGNPTGAAGYRGFEFPINSGSNFIFSAGIWVGAIVNEQRLVSTVTDGDNGTCEFWPIHIGTYPSENVQPSFGDWYLSSTRFDTFSERYLVCGGMQRDNDGDWNPSSDDLNGDGRPSPNWDGDSLDANGDGNFCYDPEPHIDEDPVGDISHDYLDNDFDGLVDLNDSDFDGDLVPGSLDDDGDGLLDEDGNARGVQEFICVYQDSILRQHVRSPDVDSHTPLDIEVVQRSFAWPEERAQDIILMEFLVRNVGTSTLEELYLAFFADLDIGAAGEGGNAASLDDYNYFDASHKMMVQYDNPHDYDGWGPGALGIQVVKTPLPWEDLRFTFANFERLSGGDPWNNADKYNLISSGDISPPTEQAGDWRMLMGFGAENGDLSLAPGEKLSFTVAFIAGTDTADVAAKAERTMFFEFDGPVISEQTLVTPVTELGPYVVSAEYDDENGVDWEYNIRLNWFCATHGNTWTTARPDSHVWTDSVTFSGTYYFTIPDTHADGSVIAENDTILFYCDGQDVFTNYSTHDIHTLIAGREWNKIEEKPHPVAQQFALHQNWPNPFNPMTRITFDLTQTGHISLRVFDVLGREVQNLVDDVQAVGSHTVMFDGSNLTSGIYFYQIQVGDFTSTKKMVLLK